jgi:hypothetical protein
VDADWRRYVYRIAIFRIQPHHNQQILRDCIPGDVYRYVSNNAKKTPEHSHKSIILNLACGPSISNPISRHTLLEG